MEHRTGWDEAGRKALAYLPTGTRIHARVYLLIKPRTNSFVFEPATDPAIMLYLDPARTRAQLENTVAHELHHIGYAAACDSTPPDAPPDSAVSTARQWLSAFGEGVAMLAAAGGPEVHAHATSPPRGPALNQTSGRRFRISAGRRTLLLDVLERRVTDADSIGRAGMSFFGVQGPWYTLGWVMASTVERSEGRAALVKVQCDPAELLAAYNAAARRSRGALPLWSDALLARLSPGPRSRGPRRRRTSHRRR